MKRTRATAILSALLLAASLTGCSTQPKKYTRDIYAMNTFMSLTAYGSSAESALSETADCISNLEKELSVTLPDSDISKLNTIGSAEVSRDTLALISEADKISRQTGGALDITVYPIVRAWGFTTGEHHIPTPAELTVLLSCVDYTRIAVEGDKVTLPEGFEIDLGSLAKGYASDRAAEILHGNGVTSAILNLGGNVCAIGSKPDGSPWKVAAASPFDDLEYLGIFSVQDKFVITSGKYERFFTGEDGKRYHHIIDPATGYPSENGVEAVTIIGTNGAECDALSTAMLVLGADKAVDYWRQYGGFDMLIVTADRKLMITSGIAQDFSDRSGFPIEIIE